ncbi:hypothetical protein [Salinigranum salinum]|uniref:hypothetical protein n=1 Tax=Salinigranum salinum TaxID=1364937 RepID=UPI0012610670|nr:hypothetical protein [Salinigranum salinum]
MNKDRVKRRVNIVRTAISGDDIERLYGEDQPTLETIRNVASSEIPNEIDGIIQEALSDIDVEFGALDVPEKDLVRVLVHAARITGTRVKWNILLTEVHELVTRVEPAMVTVTVPEVSATRGCPDCGNELVDDPDICSNCGWESEHPINS